MLLWYLLAGLLTVAAPAQCVVEVIPSAPGAHWTDLALCRSQGKLFVADETAACLRVFDRQSLAPLGTIDLSSFLPDRPQSLAVHEGTGQVYVTVDTGGANSTSRVVVLDAGTHAVKTTLSGLGISVALTIDEARNRLYTFGEGGWNQTLTAVDVNGNGIAGSLDVEALTGSAIVQYDRTGGLNPVAGELVFTLHGTDRFVVVNGPALTGQVIEAPGASGWAGIWNWIENKVIIATATWVGFCTYDRDTGTPGFVNCVTDSSNLYFNPATNRVYSDPEIEGNTVVIEGPTDQCQEIHIESGLTQIVFTAGRHHAYFVGDYGVYVRDEATLDAVAVFPIPGPGGGGIGGAQAVVDPDTDQVFIRSYRDLTEGEVSCLMAIDDRAPLIAAQPTPRTVWYGQTATLNVSVSGSGTVHYQWYAGERGDTGRPVGTDAPAFTTPPMVRSETYWVRVSDDLGTGDSEAVNVTVDHSPGVWAKHPFTLTPAQPLNAVHFVNGTTGWVVGNRGKVLKTTDGGVTWRILDDGTYFNENLKDVWFSDAFNGWAVGGGVVDGIALRTSDGGQSWTSVNTIYYMNAVRFSDALNGWAAGYLGTVLRTTDGGATWLPVSAGTPYELYDLALPDAGTILIVGYAGTVLKSVDGGTQWTQIYAGTENALNGIFMRDASRGLVATGFNSAYNYRGRIFGTEDGGATWARRACDADDVLLSAVHCPTEHLGWAVGTAGSLFKTTDGGLTWFAQPSATTADLNDVFMFGVNGGWAVGSGATLLYYTGLGRADVNLDGVVDGADLAMAAGQLGDNPVCFGDPPAGDVNRDGRLNALDLVELARIVTGP